MPIITLKITVIRHGLLFYDFLRPLKTGAFMQKYVYDLRYFYIWRRIYHKYICDDGWFGNASRHRLMF